MLIGSAEYNRLKVKVFTKRIIIPYTNFILRKIDRKMDITLLQKPLSLVLVRELALAILLAAAADGMTPFAEMPS